MLSDHHDAPDMRHSGATINYAINASESENPSKRELAAYLFSYIGTLEATKNLKGLAADTNHAVAGNREPGAR